MGAKTRRALYREYVHSAQTNLVQCTREIVKTCQRSDISTLCATSRRPSLPVLMKPRRPRLYYSCFAHPGRGDDGGHDICSFCPVTYLFAIRLITGSRLNPNMSHIGTQYHGRVIAEELQRVCIFIPHSTLNQRRSFMRT